VEYGEAETLAACYRRSLQVADELGARNIAFPAIATGVSPDQAAKIAVSSLRSAPTRIDVIRLIAFDQVAHDHLYTALGER
jgi:O-acetyl-ADP-ribose deacetylase